MAIYGSTAPGHRRSPGGSGAHLPPSGTPRGSHRQPRTENKYWPRMTWCGIDVPVIMQLEFQQFFQFEFLEVPQIRFIDRGLDIPVVTVQKTGKIPQMQCVAADVPVTAATSSSSSPGKRAENSRFSTGAVFAWLRSCRRCLRSFIDKVMMV